jgi:hypothetical protein
MLKSSMQKSVALSVCEAEQTAGVFVVNRLDMHRTKVLMYRTMVLMASPTKVRC